MSRRGQALALACSLALSGALLLGEQVWLAAKARVALRLIDGAFRAHLRDGQAHRPWRWADTHPVARLAVPRLAVRRIVLAGASGSSLAFGPGHVDGTAAPNASGNCVLAGHRDSWFEFLRQLRLGDEIVLETRQTTRTYRVVALDVRSMWDVAVAGPTPDDRLTLITCYPFDGLVGSTRRFVVVCVPVDRASEA